MFGHVWRKTAYQLAAVVHIGLLGSVEDRRPQQHPETPSRRWAWRHDEGRESERSFHRRLRQWCNCEMWAAFEVVESQLFDGRIPLTEFGQFGLARPDVRLQGITRKL